jgi:hypothetical protein
MVSATENAFVNTLETPRAIAWVCVCFGEMSSVASFVGAIISWWPSRRMSGTAIGQRLPLLPGEPTGRDETNLRASGLCHSFGRSVALHLPSWADHSLCRKSRGIST